MMRQCGECTACCTIVPVAELGKPANTKCRYEFFKGCRVHGSAKMPTGCRFWSCRWLTGDDTADLRRPDRAHYVIDIMADFVTVRDHETGAAQHIPVVQVWLDPKHPDDWRTDEAFIEFINRRGAEGVAILMRLGNQDASCIFPATFPGNDTGSFVEKGSNLKPENQHTPQQIAEAIGGVVVNLAEQQP